MADSQKCAAFIHSPLEQPSEQIRLLRFVTTRADEAGDSIQCELTAFRTDKRPAYTAISYTWGDPQKTKLILLDSKIFVVRENCWYVLSQALRHNITSYLWIDSICINQTDDDEKSLQVAMMGDIYRNATSVWICIGPHENESDILLRDISEHEKYIQVHPKKPTGRPDMSGWTEDEKTAWLYRPQNADFFEQKSCEHLNVLVAAMRSLSERSYFQRLWIIQEVYLAAVAVLCCGDSSVPFSNFCTFALDLKQYITLKTTKILTPETDPHSSINFRAWSMELDNLLNSGEDWSTMDLLSFMSYFSDSQCYDARDHMFGLLGLVNWGEEPPVLPDYTIEAWDLLYVLCSRLSILSAAALTRRISVYERDSLTRPLDAFTLALGPVGISCRHARIEELVQARVKHLPSLTSSRHHDHSEDKPLKVPVSGYARFYVPDNDNEALAACFVSKPPGQDGYYDSSMAWYDVAFAGISAKDAWNSALEQRDVPCRPVLGQNGTFALVPSDTRPGDILVSFRDQNTITGLVLREIQDPQHPLKIVGQALVDFGAVPCLSDEYCQCGENAKYHGEIGPRIAIHFDYDDFIAFTFQHTEYDELRNACTNPEMAIRRLQTSVTRRDRPFSSYATWYSGRWPESMFPPEERQMAKQSTRRSQWICGMGRRNDDRNAHVGRQGCLGCSPQ